MDFLSITQKVRPFIEPIIEEENLKLYDVLWLNEEGKNILRVMIESPHGQVTVDDCTRVSHAIEDLIEVKGIIGARYNLEVSTPGLDRPLRTKEHFMTAVGNVISLKTKDAIDGRRNYKGELKEVTDFLITMVIDGQEFKIPLDQVSQAHIVF